ncbi:MAG TPA: hypothetical protein VKF40_27670 [Burkholderiales bacterium]|nr:hypothetical protein [Burkholderiales bacterium]
MTWQSSKRSALAAVAVFLFAFADGAGAQGANPDPGPIKRIAIDSEIPQPEIPLIQGPGNFNAFLAGGGIGAAIDQQEAGKAFREYMRRNNIDISKIVFESFTRVIEEDKIFALGADADEKLKLAINTYGFGVAGFFGGNARKPLINITALLVSSSGNVVWKKTDYITNLSKLTEAYTYDQLAENPQLTVKSFAQVSVLLSRQILSDWKR